MSCGEWHSYGKLFDVVLLILDVEPSSVGGYGGGPSIRWVASWRVP